MSLAALSCGSPAAALLRPARSCKQLRSHGQAQQAGWRCSRRLAVPPARAAASSASADAAAAGAGTQAPAAAAWSTHSWMWRGHRIRYVTAGCGPPVVLIHGFGASSQHYRSNIGVLAAAGYKVWALDLLGQGGSDKPELQYEMEVWRDEIADFLAEFVGPQPAVLVGNSLGSLAALMVAAAAPAAVSGLALLNCAGGMNNKAVADDWRIQLAMPLFKLIDWLLLQPAIARSLFDKFRTRGNIRSVLQSVYGRQESVDDELVDLIHGPSCDEGALGAFVSILTGPPGPRPDHLLTDAISPDLPLLILWGDQDPMTPADGPIGRFFQSLPDTRPASTFTFLPGVGHCPHDDAPDLTHNELLPWLEAVQPPNSR